MKKEIANLNNPQFGSFGEYVFSFFVKNNLKEPLESYHKDGKDFLFRNKYVDIGANRKLNKYFRVTKISNKDVSIIFFEDFCFINYPNEIKHLLNWKEIDLIYNLWKKGHKLKLKSNSQKSYNKDYQDIKRKIHTFFSKYDYKTKIIYRTVTQKFGLKESPGNLFPNQSFNGGIVVYLDFYDFKRTVKNIRFIIAFKCDEINDIPLLDSFRLKSKYEKKKIDLIKIIETNHRSYYKSLDDLFENFFTRY
ncbi:MAG: hypothetical protein AB8G11_13850 [Saprospiraceae bacterium]